MGELEQIVDYTSVSRNVDNNSRLSSLGQKLLDTYSSRNMFLLARCFIQSVDRHRP